MTANVNLLIAQKVWRYIHEPSDYAKHGELDHHLELPQSLQFFYALPDFVDAESSPKSTLLQTIPKNPLGYHNYKGPIAAKIDKDIEFRAQNSYIYNVSSEYKQSKAYQKSKLTKKSYRKHEIV